MKGLLISTLLALGLALGTTGCESVPAKTAESIAIVTSNTHKLATAYAHVLDGVAKLDSATKASVLGSVDPNHEKALMVGNTALADDANEWVQAHKKGN